MKRALLMIIMAALSAAACFAGEDEDYIAAMESYNRQNYKEAAKLLADFSEKYQGSRHMPNAMVKLGELAGDFDAAASIFDMVMAKYPNTEYEAEAIYRSGMLYYAKADYKRAEDYFRKVISRFSNMVWSEPCYYYLMMCKNAAGAYDETLKLYKDYRDIKYYIYKNRAIAAAAYAMSKTGKHAEAAQLYVEIIKSDLDSERYLIAPEIYLKAAAAFELAGSKVEAEEYKLKGAEKYPQYPAFKTGAEPAKTPEAAAAATPAQTPVIKPAATAEKPAATAAADPAPRVFYTVQVGAFSTLKNAELMRDKLNKSKRNAFIKSEGKMHKVLAGKFQTKEEADRFAEKMAREDRLKSWLVKQGWE